MSGTTNPLAATAPAPAPPQNSLAAGAGATPPPKGPPSVAQAVAAVAGQNLGPADLAQHINTVNYTAPELGRLLQKPTVTRKDVVKATADAVGARKVSADDAIKFISSMPEDPDKLRPWLQQLYHSNLVASVALHSVGHQMLTGGQGAPQSPGMPTPGVPAPVSLAAQQPPGGVA